MQAFASAAPADRVLPFTQIHQALVYENTISHGARFLYILLCTINNDTKPGHCFPSEERLADYMDVSINTVRKYLKELQGHGWINTIRRGLTETNLYDLRAESRSQEYHDKQMSATAERRKNWQSRHANIADQEVSNFAPIRISNYKKKENNQNIDCIPQSYPLQTESKELAIASMPAASDNQEIEQVESEQDVMRKTIVHSDAQFALPLELDQENKNTEKSNDLEKDHAKERATHVSDALAATR